MIGELPSLSRGRGDDEIGLEIFSRSNQASGHESYAELFHERIHDLLPPGLPGDHQVAAPLDISVQAPVLFRGEGFPHVGNNQDIDVFRNLPVQRHLEEIEPVVDQRVTERPVLCEPVVIAVPLLDAVPLAVSLHETDFR